MLIELAGPLASAYAAMGRAGEAIALLEEAVAQAIALRHRFGHILGTGGLAEAYLAAGRVEDALPLAQLYVEVARTGHLRGAEGWALHLVAEARAEKLRLDFHRRQRIADVVCDASRHQPGERQFLGSDEGVTRSIQTIEHVVECRGESTELVIGEDPPALAP